MKSDSHDFNTSYPTSIFKKVGINHMEFLPKAVVSLFHNSIVEFDKKNYTHSIQLLYQSYCLILLKELNPTEEISTDEISQSLIDYSEILKSKGILIDDSILHKFNQITYSLEDPSPDSKVLENCLNDAKFIFEYYIEYYKSKNIDLKISIQEESQPQVIEDKKKIKPIVISKNFTNSIKMEFSLIPAGEFVMGALPTDKDANDDESPLIDPKGPDKGEFKTMRGGSWHCVPRLTRTTQRYHHIPSSKSFLIGFRLVKQI